MSDFNMALQLQVQQPTNQAATAHATHLVADHTQPFPKFLETSWTMLESMSIEEVEFDPGQFSTLLSSKRLMPGLQNIVVLNIQSVENLPSIVLTSCVQLKELSVFDVQIRPDASLKWNLPGPRLAVLTCRRMLEQTYRDLVSIVDVTHLQSFECDLVVRFPWKECYGPKGPQYVLDRCANTLELLTLHSDYAFKYNTERNWVYLCNLSLLVMLRHLVFITSVKDGDFRWNQQPHILDQLLATISRQTRMLESLDYRMEVCIDEKLPRNLRASMVIDTSTLLKFFENKTWRQLDYAIARVASGRIMRFNMVVSGWMATERWYLYDLANHQHDSRAFKALLEKWAFDNFVAVREQQQIDFGLEAQIVEKIW